ncbi:hypothetical protein [Hymenobacter negativus]|uniref:Lipoprotein n=1 Tax=Hymenobacter negativus TaxID=2795026 RepID=A0ABS3QK87_9BACT|nr:hypothetical protein [Hymenobacter negativus]MBO2011659.1 hypothetical protein [Hymenobacter negativus]
MKTLFRTLALAVAGTACQHQDPPTQAAAQPVAQALVSAVSTTPDGKLTPAIRELLQRCDFSPLLQTVGNGTARHYSHVQNGFFGSSHYRIEMVLTEVRRDSVHPTVYYLRGKDRYQGVITPFAGTVTLTHLFSQPRYSARQIAEAKAEFGEELRNEADMYSVLGDFELREDKTRRGSGTFRGRLAIDWSLEKDGSVELSMRNGQAASQGGEIKYEGRWTSAATHRTRPVVWVEDLLSYVEAQHVLDEFNIGDREVVINPRYAHLGWNTYWENDEWWADSAGEAPLPSGLNSAAMSVRTTLK